MKTISNIFLTLGIASIIGMVILYVADYGDEAFIFAGIGMVCTFVGDITYKQHKKELKKD